MNSKPYKSFFLLTPADAGEKQEEQAMTEDHFLIFTQPLIFNSKRCLRKRKKKDIEIMTIDSPKQAS